MRFISVNRFALIIAMGLTSGLCRADWIQIRFEGAISDVFLNTEEGRLYLGDRTTPLLQFEQTRTRPGIEATNNTTTGTFFKEQNQNFEFSSAQTLDSSAPDVVKNRNRQLSIRIEGNTAYQIVNSPSGSSVHTGVAQVIERTEPSGESGGQRPIVGQPVSGVR